jgi:hypothetical protein
VRQQVPGKAASSIDKHLISVLSCTQLKDLPLSPAPQLPYELRDYSIQQVSQEHQLLNMPSAVYACPASCTG